MGLCDSGIRGLARVREVRTRDTPGSWSPVSEKAVGQGTKARVPTSTLSPVSVSAPHPCPCLVPADPESDLSGRSVCCLNHVFLSGAQPALFPTLKFITCHSFIDSLLHSFPSSKHLLKSFPALLLIFVSCIIFAPVARSGGVWKGIHRYANFLGLL